VGPPPPGATRGLGILAMRLSASVYASEGGLSTPMRRAYSPKCVEGYFSEVGVLSIYVKVDFPDHQP
jgi:hypothetical protein